VIWVHQKKFLNIFYKILNKFIFKVWSLLCEKDEKYKRDPYLFQRQKRINPRMRAMLFDWIMDVKLIFKFY
jgi:hypothetical protein